MIPGYDLSSIDAKRQLLDIDRADAEESLYTFLKSAWHIFDPAPWVDAWCIDAIAEHLQAVVDGQIKRLIINIPPRCAKSAITSIVLPAWTWAQPVHTHTSGPGVSFMYASFKDALALRDSVQCRKVIESKWYQDRWGDRFQLSDDQNTKSRFNNSASGYRLVTSVESKGATGDGANCFVAGTPVSTPDGQKNIEDLRVGDAILAFDTLLEKVVISRVLATAKRKSNDICTLHEISGHRFTCTKDHPVYSPGRGFVKAGEMGPGDGLLIHENTCQHASRKDCSSSVRQLREENESTSLLGQEGIEAGKQRRLLQQEVLRETSRNKKSTPLRNLWRCLSKENIKVLFRSLQGKIASIERGSKANYSLRNLRRSMQEWLFVLLKKMREQSSLQTNEGRCQFEIPWQWQIFESFSENENLGIRERQENVLGMFRARQNSEAIETEKLSSRSPHRRQQQEQCSGKSTDVMRILSQETPSWRTSHVERIFEHSDQAQFVYDIQVEARSNFFADGILVHNCIILDDCNSTKEIESEAVIASTLDWFDGTLGTRFNNPKLGAIIEIQQRVGENDLTGHILSKNSGEWVHLCLPMRFEKDRSFVTAIGWEDPRKNDGDLLWPERFGETEVKGLETWMGEWRAAGQLQQRPEPRGGGIIKREWWKLWEEPKYPVMDYKVGCLDTAYTLKEMNDPSGMIVWGIYSAESQELHSAMRVMDHEGRPMYIGRSTSEEVPHAMLMHAWTERYEFHQLIEKVVKTAIDYNIDLLMIENKAAGISIAQEIRRLYANESFSVQLFDPKSQDKFARLVSVQHLFQEGLIYAPDRKFADAVMTQCAQFPRGKHDEYVDMTSMGLRYLRDTGLLSRTTERRAEVDNMLTFRGNQSAPLYPA